MDLKKYAELCSKREQYKQKIDMLGSNAAETVVDAVLKGFRVCNREIEIMERQMSMSVKSKGVS